MIGSRNGWMKVGVVMMTSEIGSEGKTSRRQNKLARLRQLVAENPDSAEAHMKLGTALIRTSSISEAESSLKRAIELKPDYAEAMVNLGGIMLSRFDFTGCVEMNKKAVECDPDFFLAHYNKGLGHMYLGQSEDMLDCFRKASALDPEHPGCQYHLAVALFAVGQVDEARVWLNRALAAGYAAEPEFLRAIERHRGGQVATVEIEPKH